MSSSALEAFHPGQFGFEPYGNGWINRTIGDGGMVIAPVSWQHAQVPTIGFDETTDPLHLIYDLQARTWGMPPEFLVPVNVMAIIGDGGGSVLAAYDPEKGFTKDGWRGFIIGFGSSNGTLVSHMLGVREDLRGNAAIGWYIKIIQAYIALQDGHHSMTWTFDPMRGVNARLNLEKLGATVQTLTIDKYGVLPSTLYGDVPSDRFSVTWNLLAPRTTERIKHVFRKIYQPLSPEAVAEIPEVTVANLDDVQQRCFPKVRYRIPGDIDTLMRDNPHAAITWRQEMRQVIGTLITTKRALVRGNIPGNLAAISVDTRSGPYQIKGFATGPDDNGERQSFYLLERKDG
jgi:predicted GNAT superfamily acetyltransferase